MLSSWVFAKTRYRHQGQTHLKYPRNRFRSVYYGDRLSRDFDHVEAVLRIGKNRKAKESIYIRNETLDRPEITEIGALGALDCIATHLRVPNEELRRQVGRLEQIYFEYESQGIYLSQEHTSESSV